MFQNQFLCGKLFEPSKTKAHEQEIPIQIQLKRQQILHNEESKQRQSNVQVKQPHSHSCQLKDNQDIGDKVDSITPRFKIQQLQQINMSQYLVKDEQQFSIPPISPQNIEEIQPKSPQVDQDNIFDQYINFTDNVDFEQQNQLSGEESIQKIMDDNQFIQLKEQMSKIQQIAIMEISKLKDRLIEKQMIIEKLQNTQNICNKSMKDVGVNTDPDSRNEEIALLKQSIIRHIRINKQLTIKLNHNGNENDSHLSNLSMKMEMPSKVDKIHNLKSK